MGQTRNLVVGVAEFLADVGLGVWRPDGVFGPTDTAITTKAVPPSPDRVIAVGPYTVGDLVEGQRVQGIQLRTRGTAGDPLSADDLDDAIYQALHGREGLVLGGVTVHLMYRASHGTLGIDADHRPENTANFHALIDAPTPSTR